MIDPNKPDFENTPTSGRRPAFDYCPRDPAAAPAVTIVTPYYNAGPEFEETARTVLGQSLQQIEWLIVNDGSTDAAALEQLDRFRNRHPRVRVVDHADNRGLSAARNTGFREARAPHVLLLDADDLLEATAAEKWFWALESHTECAFVKSYTVGFGHKCYIWPKGYEQGAAFLTENQVTATSLIRRSVHEAVQGFPEDIRGGLEDWEFWIKCAHSGHWGRTVPEYLDWYRRRDGQHGRWENLRQQRSAEFRERLMTRYGSLWETEFPRAEPRWHMPNETVSDTLPCENHLLKAGRRVLVIAPWLTLGGADRFNLDLVELLSRTGWEVTIATTLSGDHSWLPEFARHTPDVFALHHFLRLADYPRFLRYLIESRAVDVVLVTNSELGYLLLPYLRAHAPHVAFVDFCHMEEEGWKSGGYPRLSVEYQSALDLNIVSSAHLKQWMTARGADAARIEVCYTGIDVGRWKPDATERDRMRTEHDVPAAGPVILYAGRICAQKQPRVFAATMRLLAERGVDFTALVAGDGPDLDWLRGFVQEQGLGGRVRLLGRVPGGALPALMAAADIYFLPSEWEGIALSIYEAMAVGLPVVAADVGGQRELLTEDCGILIARSDETQEAEAYAAALERLLRDAEVRRRMGTAARSRVAAGFQLTAMHDRMVELFEHARTLSRDQPRPLTASGIAKTAAFQAIEYVRLFNLSEWLWAQRNTSEAGVRAYGLLARWFAPWYAWGVRRGWNWLSVLRARTKVVLLGRR